MALKLCKSVLAGTGAVFFLVSCLAAGALYALGFAVQDWSCDECGAVKTPERFTYDFEDVTWGHELVVFVVLLAGVVAVVLSTGTGPARQSIRWGFVVNAAGNVISLFLPWVLTGGTGPYHAGVAAEEICYSWGKMLLAHAAVVSRLGEQNGRASWGLLLVACLWAASIVAVSALEAFGVVDELGLAITVTESIVGVVILTLGFLSGHAWWTCCVVFSIGLSVTVQMLPTATRFNNSENFSREALTAVGSLPIIASLFGFLHRLAEDQAPAAEGRPKVEDKGRDEPEGKQLTPHASA